MPRILQLTDIHMVAPPKLVSGVLDTPKLFQRQVNQIQEAMPRLGPIDAVLVTGDVSDDGSHESYALFRQMIEPLGLPLLVIPGNHDAREPMRDAFADLGLFPTTGRLNWTRQIGELRIVGIDTLIEGSGGGVVDAATLEFLEQELAGEGPILLALHHPPFISGIAFMDNIGLSGIPEFADLLSRSRADIRIVCGHLHAALTGQISRFPALVGPSPCSTFQYDLRTDAPIGYFEGSGGFMVHQWDGVFLSAHIPAQIGPGPHNF